MMQETSPEFYNAAEYYGVGSFADAQSEATAELSLMLRSVRANDPDVRLRREDLVGYHFLHFGSDPKIVEEAIESCLAVEGDAPWATEAREHLRNTIIEAPPPPENIMPVGRIALSQATEVDPSLGPGFQKYGKFLFPGQIFRDQTAIYLSRTSFEHEEGKIYIDSIKVEGRYMDNLVQAISSGATMLKINSQYLPRSTSSGA